MNIMQGDACNVPIKITQNDVPLDPAVVADLEVCIGTGIRKTLGDGEVSYDEESALWYIRLTQAETFAMEGTQEAFVRIKYHGEPYADVIGRRAGVVNVMDTTSEEVL